MLIFRNNNHFGDCLLQLGLLKMLAEQHKTEVGFYVKDELQWQAIKYARFLRNAGIYGSFSTIGEDYKYIDFIADESARGKMSLIEMWAQSIPSPCSLKGELKPFIQLRDSDYTEANKLNLKGKVFVAPFKLTCSRYPQVFEGMQFLQRTLANKGYYLLGASGDPAWSGFTPLLGLPIRTVGVLLKEARALYCINNCIANLAWAVGLKNIHEWVTPVTEWAKIPYSERIN